MNLGNRFSQHSFAQIPSANMARSKFDRSFAAKDTMDFDDLVPFFVDEVLPGDTHNLNVKMFARLATQVVPVLDNMMMDFWFFFVPNRLVWDNWERFNGAQDDPGDSTDYLVPTVSAPVGGYAINSNFDHLGIPTGKQNVEIVSLPFRAINLIWNEWFRDQNLQNSINVVKADGPDVYTDFPLLKPAKKHDYFTSCLPWPQKGPGVDLPFGGLAPVVGTGAFTVPGQNLEMRTAQGGAGTAIGFNSMGGSNHMVAGSSQANLYDWKPSQPVSTAITGLSADLSDAASVTINQFRQAIMMQSLLELDARGGTRYVEIIKAHFNVVSPDFRLQRPEFLSGGTIPINQHPVTQTSESGTSPQASLAAYSTASEFGNKIGYSKSFVEHGYVIGFMSARAEVTYQQGLNRMWSRSTRYDFFWPKLQELGEQAVLNKEIYAQGTLQDSEVFGYIERYGEYRFRPSEIRGQFRSTYAETLDVWHLAEEFATLPTLSNTFIERNTPIERVLAVTDPTYPDLLVDFWFDYKAARPIMSYGVPATLGRF